MILNFVINFPICVANTVSLIFIIITNSLVNSFIYMAIDFDPIVESLSGYNLRN